MDQRWNQSTPRWQTPVPVSRASPHPPPGDIRAGRPRAHSGRQDARQSSRPDRRQRGSHTSGPCFPSSCPRHRSEAWGPQPPCHRGKQAGGLGRPRRWAGQAGTERGSLRAAPPAQEPPPDTMQGAGWPAWAATGHTDTDRPCAADSCPPPEQNGSLPISLGDNTSWLLPGSLCIPQLTEVRFLPVHVLVSAEKPAGSTHKFKANQRERCAGFPARVSALPLTPSVSVSPREQWAHAEGRLRPAVRPAPRLQLAHVTDAAQVVCGCKHCGKRLHLRGQGRTPAHNHRPQANKVPEPGSLGRETRPRGLLAPGPAAGRPAPRSPALGLRPGREGGVPCRGGWVGVSPGGLVTGHRSNTSAHLRCLFRELPARSPSLFLRRCSPFSY